jgi:hypothetical protein
MRGFASYLVAGVLAVLAMDLIAPPVGLGLALGAWPAVRHDDIVQSVNRGGKADRLLVPSTAVGKTLAPRKSPIVMVGCDPVFSSLAASARANAPGRCLV